MRLNALPIASGPRPGLGAAGKKIISLLWITWNHDLISADLEHLKGCLVGAGEQVGLEHILRRTAGFHLALVEEHNLVGKARHQVNVMQGHQNRQLLF